jgi:hypothetical protein
MLSCVTDHNHEGYIISKLISIYKVKINFQQVNYIPKKKEGGSPMLPVSTLLRSKQKNSGRSAILEEKPTSIFK